MYINHNILRCLGKTGHNFWHLLAWPNSLGLSLCKPKAEMPIKVNPDELFIYAHLFNEENPDSAKRLEDHIFNHGSKMVPSK